MTDDELLPFKNKDGKYLMVNIEPIEEATSVTFNYRYYSLKNIETHNFNAHLSLLILILIIVISILHLFILCLSLGSVQ